MSCGATGATMSIPKRCDALHRVFPASRETIPHPMSRRKARSWPSARGAAPSSATAAKAAADREKTVAITDFASEPWGRKAKPSAPRAQKARTATEGMRGTRGSRNLPAFEPCNSHPPEREPTHPTKLVPCVAKSFVDTAEVYSNGVSKEITGRAKKAVRDDVVLATKVRFPMGQGPNDVGLSRKHMTQGCEDSLRRLGTDYLDLYQVHCWDAATPLEETLSALTHLVRSGKVRYMGVSNFTGWQLMRSLDASWAHGYERFVCLQPQYSLVERNIEREVLPVCVEEGLGVIPWSPPGGGFLPGNTGAVKSHHGTPGSPGPRSPWESTGTAAPQSATGPRWTWWAGSPKRRANPTPRSHS